MFNPLDQNIILTCNQYLKLLKAYYFYILSIPNKSLKYGVYFTNIAHLNLDTFFVGNAWSIFKFPKI